MSVRSTFFVVIAFVVCIGIAPSRACAGELDPPAGPVAPTMKSLDQVESRTPISPATTPGDVDATFVISTPGSYYLTGNLAGEDFKHGIKVTAAQVTLDLNGFAIVGAGDSLSGISAESSVDSITIRNGIVSNWDTAGIDLSALATAIGGTILIESVHATYNAVGFHASATGVIRNCVAKENSANGFTLVGSLIVENCVSATNFGAGFHASQGVTIHRCVARFNANSGITAVTRCTVTDCTCDGNTANNGIWLPMGSVDCRIEGNQCNNNSPYGIRNETLGSLIFRNTASGNSSSGFFLATPPSWTGPIIANTDLSILTNPFANVTY